MGNESGVLAGGVGVVRGVAEHESDFVLREDECVRVRIAGMGLWIWCGVKVEIVFCDEGELLEGKIREEEFGSREDVKRSVIEGSEEAACLTEVPIGAEETIIGHIRSPVVLMRVRGAFPGIYVPVKEIREQIFKEFGRGLHAGRHELDGGCVGVDGDSFLSDDRAGIDAVINEVP
jgi:hypothetical protein